MAIHAHSLKSQGCCTLEKGISTSCPSCLQCLGHTLLLQFMSSRGFHLLHDGFFLLHPSSLPSPWPTFVLPVLQVQTEHLVCFFCCFLSLLPFLALSLAQPQCISPLTSPLLKVSKPGEGLCLGAVRGFSGTRLVPLWCS